MPHLLRPKYAKPIEREYEAWIVSGIERYFRGIGVDYAIWAVSPNEETRWPADERLDVAEKIVGLQFKQAKLANSSQAFDRLTWSFHHPPGQYQLISNRAEIFYCLPTFINRDIKDEALQHCLFWQPPPGRGPSAWYDNPSATTAHSPLKDAMRWGRFVEGLSSCELGRKVESKQARMAFYTELMGTVRQVQETVEARTVGEGLYLLAFRLDSGTD